MQVHAYVPRCPLLSFALARHPCCSAQEIPPPRPAPQEVAVPVHLETRGDRNYEVPSRPPWQLVPGAGGVEGALTRDARPFAAMYWLPGGAAKMPAEPSVRYFGYGGCGCPPCTPPVCSRPLSLPTWE